VRPYQGAYRDIVVRSLVTLKALTYAPTGGIERWRAIRAAIHNKVCRHAFDREGNTFVQYYGGMELDASLLMIALVGFLPPGDSRIKGTAEAIERDLVADGFVRGIALSRRWTSCLPGKLHSFRVAFG